MKRMASPPRMPFRAGSHRLFTEFGTRTRLPLAVCLSMDPGGHDVPVLPGAGARAPFRNSTRNGGSELACCRDLCSSSGKKILFETVATKPGRGWRRPEGPPASRRLPGCRPEARPERSRGACPERSRGAGAPCECIIAASGCILRPQLRSCTPPAKIGRGRLVAHCASFHHFKGDLLEGEGPPEPSKQGGSPGEPAVSERSESNQSNGSPSIPPTRRGVRPY